MKFPPFTLFIILVLLNQSIWGSSYNEFSHDNKIRAHVKSFIESQGKMILPPSPEAIKKLTRNPLGDKIKILPIPLILSNSEYVDTISPGIEQRTRALRAFFHDIVIGNSIILKKKKFFDQKFIENVFSMEGLALKFLKKIWKDKNISDISMIYGPDLVRNSSGKWMILEDNIGPVGGSGDTTAIHKAFHDATGLKPSLNFTFKDDLTSAILLFLSTQNLEPGSSEVVAFIKQEKYVSEINKLTLDLEDERRTKILEKIGIKVVDPNSISDKELEYYLSGKIKSIINFNIPKNTLVRKLKFFNAFKDDRFSLFQSPGTSIISNKAIAPYVEDFIEFYLNEKPILKTQETSVLFDWKLPIDSKNWVIKKTTSLQGKDVFLLLKYNDLQLKEFQESLDEKKAYYEMSMQALDPLYVKQRYLNHSYIPADFSDSTLKFGIDIRPITYVFNDLIFVSKTPWGRSAPKINYALNNVSQGAYELVVIRHCEKLFSRWR